MTARITLYPGKINSPASTLSAIALIGDTTLSITDAAVLPAGPNLVTLGTGENAETVLYTGKSGNDLTGCTRSFQGTAIQWAAGTSVRRALTAYDFDSLRTNQNTVIDEMPVIALTRNGVINGNFDVWQRGTTFTQNDDLYGPDRWNLLQEANSAWTFSQESTIVPTGSKYSLKCLNVTLDKQCALVYLMENISAMPFLNGNVSIAFQARSAAAAVVNLRAAVLSWNSTADTVTSDVIATWQSDGTNPTWATNWTMENTPANLALSTSAFARYTIEGIVLDTASTTNLALVIWTDDGTIAANDVFYVGQVMLCKGDIAYPFQIPRMQDELIRCQRFYYRMAADKAYTHFAPGYNSSTTVSYVMRPHPTPMRIAPVVATSTTAAQFAVFHAATNTACSVVPADNNSSIDTLSLTATVASGLTAGQGCHLEAANSTSPWIECNAEL